MRRGSGATWVFAPPPPGPGPHQHFQRWAGGPLSVYKIWAKLASPLAWLVGGLLCVWGLMGAEKGPQPIPLLAGSQCPPCEVRGWGRGPGVVTGGLQACLRGHYLASAWRVGAGSLGPSPPGCCCWCQLGSLPHGGPPTLNPRFDVTHAQARREQGTTKWPLAGWPGEPVVQDAGLWAPTNHTGELPSANGL